MSGVLPDENLQKKAQAKLLILTKPQGWRELFFDILAGKHVLPWGMALNVNAGAASMAMGADAGGILLFGASENWGDLLEKIFLARASRKMKSQSTGCHQNCIKGGKRKALPESADILVR